MKKLLSLRIIGCVLFVSLMLFPANSVVHMSIGNVFTKYFTEPIEVMYIVFYDGYLLKFTSYHTNKIDMQYGTFREALEKKGRKIRDIVIMIHNHQPRGTRNFSEGDLKFWRRMNGDGFRGSFCLWYVGKIRCKRCQDG